MSRGDSAASDFARRAGKRARRLGRTQVLIPGEGGLIVFQHLMQGDGAELVGEEPIRARMELGNGLPEGCHGAQGKPALRRHAVIDVGLVEAAHDKRPFDSGACPAETESAVRSIRYRHDLKI